MEVNNPDLVAFESATRAQLRARELGKIGALIPNLRPNAPVPEAMGKSSHENAPRESQCGASSHEQSDSDESPEDLEKSTEWIFQGYLFFGSDGWRTDEAYEAEVRAVVEQQYLPKVPVPVQHMAIFYDSTAKPDRDVLKMPIRGYVQANSAIRRQWRKWIGAAELDWSKVHGGIPCNKWYLMDTHDTNPENPKRLLLRHGRYQNFRVNGTAWTFSGTIGVDPCGDESCDLVEIARVKFMAALAAHDRPHGIQYLTVHCDISPLVLSSGSGEVTKVPVRGFLQTAKTSWNFMWEHWLPDFQWRPLRGGLCGNEEFEKALNETRLDTDHPAAGSLWSEMLAQGALGRNNAGRRASSSSSGSSRAQSRTSSSTGQVQIIVAPRMQAEAPAHVAHTTRQAASAGGASRPAGGAKRKASTSRSSSLSGRVSKRRSLPNSRIPKFQLIQVIFPLSLYNTTYERIGRVRKITPRRNSAAPALPPAGEVEAAPS